ncbi:MAG: hypothetical protein JW940_21395, partial [Polyangiaceae bacterium]|nr:hypothetical protein [Polyangiaceae bacterium]
TTSALSPDRRSRSPERARAAPHLAAEHVGHQRARRIHVGGQESLSGSAYCLSIVTVGVDTTPTRTIYADPDDLRRERTRPPPGSEACRLIIEGITRPIAGRIINLGEETCRGYAIETSALEVPPSGDVTLSIQFGHPPREVVLHCSVRRHWRLTTESGVGLVLLADDKNVDGLGQWRLFIARSHLTGRYDPAGH